MEDYAASAVESMILEKQGNPPLLFPGEHIPALVVESFPVLGKLTALRFLEWVQKNPEGVVSLPTGKTPEYFIKHMTRYLSSWNVPEIQKELAEAGLDAGRKPDMRGLYFVQMDDFYPMNPLHKNSFHYFVKTFYLGTLGLDAEKALLIDLSQVGIPAGRDLRSVWPDGRVDLSLRTRHPENDREREQKKVIEAVDAYALAYENRIRELGGIGFFLGGIGPDGHIAFNVRGSNFYSTTRLSPLNYETAAAAAGDLGGIEISRHRLAFTIGLSTITYNRSVTAVIFAAGQAKADMVAQAIEGGRRLDCPASVLSGVPDARFYLTQGAASSLQSRRCAQLEETETVPAETASGILIEIACSRKKQVDALTDEDLASDAQAAILSKSRDFSLPDVKRQVRKQLEEKITSGRRLPRDKTFLHTAPHHDDIMLGYMPAIMHLVRSPENHHHFAYMTSGFTSVTNRYLLAKLKQLRTILKKRRFDKKLAAGYFQPDRSEARAQEAYLYLNALAARDAEAQAVWEASRLLRALVEIYEEEDPESIVDRIDELVNYLRTQYPGKKDIEHIQKLKGMLREWEGDLLWGYVGVRPERVHHMRLGFYKGDIFTEAPERNRDMKPVLDLLLRIKPDVVTVALDPEASGPDTHYKVLQAVAGALHEYIAANPAPVVWGYRNVWYRFPPQEATHYVPTTLNTMAVMENSFMNCFGSQKEASFPSYEYDGPFCHLAQRIWIEQFECVKTCLGETWFRQNAIPQIRAMRGFVFLKEMDCDSFFEFADQARQSTEQGG